MQEYTIKALISPLEARVIARLREVQGAGFGSVEVKVHGGEVVECVRSVREDRTALARLQTCEAEKKP